MLGTLIHDAVLLVTTALTAPCIIINGDTNPRVLLRASTVANCDTPRRGTALTVSRDLRSNTSRWSTSAIKCNANRGGTVHFSQLANETIPTSINVEVSIVILHFISSTGLTVHRGTQADSRARLGTLVVLVDTFFIILTSLGGTAAAWDGAVMEE
jgi:hypothetical protein